VPASAKQPLFRMTSIEGYLLLFVIFVHTEPSKCDNVVLFVIYILCFASNFVASGLLACACSDTCWHVLVLLLVLVFRAIHFCH